MNSDADSNNIKLHDVSTQKYSTYFQLAVMSYVFPGIPLVY